MKKWIPILILSIAQFVMVLDGTVMNVSISTIAKDLGTNITGMQTAITVFTLTMAAFMLTGGKLGDIWGRQRAFRIGSVIYGVGSFITALAPTLGVLFIGWSVVEGLGAVLVIPAIAALAAANYAGKDRVVAFSLLGAATGLAAALGPIIGGFMTTYLSWRYVFVAETIIMAIVLLVSGKVTDAKLTKKSTLDVPSVLLSASGMALLVFGVLQSRSWGWILPLGAPEVNGNPVTPLGISLVVYLIFAGIVVLKLFYNRQVRLTAERKQPLLKVSMLQLPVLRSGLATLVSQYFTVAAVFFIIPVYLQTILGYDALQTGLKLVPMSIGLLLCTVIGSKLTATHSARQLVRAGLLIMAAGAVFILGSIDVELGSVTFWLGMFLIGAGFGLLASQLGNVNMSAVSKEESAEAGGLQGVSQNLGQSFGTALIGSVFLLTLTSGFTGAIQNSPDISDQAKAAIMQSAEKGVGIASTAQVEQYVVENGGDETTAKSVAITYQNSQLDSLRISMVVVVVSLLGSLAVSKSLPSKLAKR